MQALLIPGHDPDGIPAIEQTAKQVLKEMEICWVIEIEEKFFIPWSHTHPLK